MPHPVGGPSLPPTPSTTHPLDNLPHSHHAFRDYQHLSSQPSSFTSDPSSTTTSVQVSSRISHPGKASISTCTPSTSSLTSKPNHLRSNRSDIQQRTTDLLRDLVIPYQNGRDASELSPHQSWNLDIVTPSMTSRPDITIADLQHSKHKPHTDSGYASSEKTRQRASNNSNVLLGATYEGGQDYTYDEPIGSVAQQDHFLIDQQYARPLATSVISSSSAPASLPRHLSNNSFYCAECSEGFNTKSEMTKHMARHNKKFVCDWPNCPRRIDGFATKNDLDRHRGSVHHDGSVVRKEYRCCVPGCKDPNKLWDRKDNFKAHVKRMHANEDADDVVEQSQVHDTSLSADQSADNSEIFQPDYPPSSLVDQSSNVAYTGPGMIDNYSVSYSYNMPQDPWPQEGDMYDPPQQNPSRTQPYIQQPIGPSSYSNSNLLHSATMGATSNYPSSNTLAATNHPTQDSLGGPILSHREMLTPFMFPNATNTNQIRPFDARSAPVGNNNNNNEDLNSHVFEWPQAFEQQFSTADNTVAPIDPSLQTVQSGAWQQHSSPSNSYPQHIPDQQSHSNLNLSTDEQPTAGQGVDQRRTAMMQKITPILQSLSHEEVRLMMEAYQRHPAMSNKGSCTINSVIEATEAAKARQKAQAKPFPCRRDGCPKSFSQKNIRTKHEKRHDRLFFCTFDGCYSRFGSKDDLRRHEKGPHKPQAFHGWRCFHDDVPTSQHKIGCEKFFQSKEKFEQHRRDDHKERSAANNTGLKAAKNCYLHQGDAGPFWCGFCNRIIPNEPNGTDGTVRDKFRYDHIDHHVTKEGKNMSHWIDLKSAGCTKIEVRSAESEHAPEHSFNDGFNDESDDGDDEETPEQPLGATPTIDGSGSQTIPRYSHQLDMLSAEDRPRKRAFSDANLDVADAAMKRQKIVKYPTQRQAPSMSRGASEMTRLSQTQTFIEATRQPQAYMMGIRCCQCNRCRPMIATRCACNHERCNACPVFDQVDARNYSQGGSSHRF